MTIETILEENNFLLLKNRLKNNQIDVNFINEDEETPLFLAIKYSCDLDIIKELIKNGADYSYVNSEGLGIIDIAIEKGGINILTFLVDEKNLEIKSTKRKSGFTPLMSAVCYNKIEVVNFLIKRGVDITFRDSSGLDALGYAKKLRLKKMEELLKLHMQNF